MIKWVAAGISLAVVTYLDQSLILPPPRFSPMAGLIYSLSTVIWLNTLAYSDLAPNLCETSALSESRLIYSTVRNSHLRLPLGFCSASARPHAIEVCGFSSIFLPRQITLSMYITLLLFLSQVDVSKGLCSGHLSIFYICWYTCRHGK